MQQMSPDETVRTALQISQSRLRAQHELVVEFGVKSLKADDIDDLLQHACVIVAKGMSTAYAKILRYRAELTDFLLAYGVGWDATDIGSATVGADEASPAGYAYATDRPVISNHLGREHRFRTPSLLRKYGIERAINVPIRGASTPYGVLEADSSDGDDFIETDLVFMEGIANIVSMALERIALHDTPRGQHLYSETILNASPDCVKIMSPQGELEFFNAPGLCQMEIDFTDQRQTLAAAVARRVAFGGSGRLAAGYTRGIGKVRVLLPHRQRRAALVGRHRCADLWRRQQDREDHRGVPRHHRATHS